MKKESKEKKWKPRAQSLHAPRSSGSRVESQAASSQETTCGQRLTSPQTEPLTQRTQVSHAHQGLSSQREKYAQRTTFVASGRVRDLGDAGEGIAALRSELPQLDGRIAFLDGAIPGDKIVVSRPARSSLKKQGPLHLKRTDFLIEESSPYRQTAFCPAFPDCGGCTLQELQYPESLKFKSRKVRELLIRIGKRPQAEAEKLVRPCIGMDEPFRFRSRVQIKVQARRAGKNQTACLQEGAAQSGQAQISKAPAENPRWGQAANTQAERRQSEGAQIQVFQTAISPSGKLQIEKNQAENTGAKIPQLGFYKRDSHEIADFSFCAIQPRAFDAFREVARCALGKMLASGGEAARAAEAVNELQLRQNHQGNHFLVVVVCSSAAGERRQESGKNCMKKQRGASSDSQQKLQSPDAPPQTESFFPLTNALEQEAERQGANLSLWLNIKASGPSADHVESSVATNFIKLSGPDHLEDNVLGLRYALSPQAFSQTNLVQDEVLYQTALDLIDEYIGPLLQKTDDQPTFEAGTKLHDRHEQQALEAEIQAFENLRDVACGRELHEVRVVQSKEAPSILELYCGSGIISLLLSRHFPDADISAVEIVPAAVRDARANAALNGLDQQNLRFICGDASDAFNENRLNLYSQGASPDEAEPSTEQLIDRSDDSGPNPGFKTPSAEQSAIASEIDPTTAESRLGSSPYTLIVVDPPRQGLTSSLSETIKASGTPFLLYISCNPATLARDIARLSPAYQLKTIQPIDMFPWTGHVETVVLMSRVDGK